MSNRMLQTSNNPTQAANNLLQAANPLQQAANQMQSANPFAQAANPMQSTNPFSQPPNPVQSANPFSQAAANAMQSANPFSQAAANAMQSANPFSQAVNPMQSANPTQAANLMSQATNPMQAANPMLQSANPMLKAVNPMLQPANPMLKAANQLLQGGNPMQQLIKGDRNMYMGASDDSLMMRQIQETHVPDGRLVDVKPLLFLVEDILKRATLNVDALILPGAQAQVETMEDKANQASAIAMLEGLSHIIDRISCEMGVKCLSGVDGHSSTVSLLHLLTNYPWNAKLMLTLSAFALNYGEFWLLAQIYSSNQLARSMAILKQVPVIMEHSGPLKSRFDALNNLIKSVLELTRCIVAFEELPSMYITRDEPALSTAIATIPTAVYWSMRSIICCATQITSLTSLGHEYAISSTELTWELSTLAHKINNILEHLRNQMAICLRQIDERREVETVKTLKSLFEMIHIDNMKVLKSLIYAKDDLLPIVDGSTKRRVSLDVLRRKNVLLLISGLDISREELSILEQIYSESRTHATRMEKLYELVWMPIVDHSIKWTDPMNKHFEDLRSTMPWYSVHHPSLIDPAVIKFVKERWHFRNKAILVVLDPQGRELSPNAIHMMWIWGSNAFPFTSLREEDLWKGETWRLELLISDMDPTISNWIREGKYIFLYGGDDIEWIRKFTTTARAVATAARIPLEMAYVGKSTKREQVRRAIASITLEKMSYCWTDQTLIWFFWTRLESMLFSKIQLKRADDQDPMMQEIKKLLSYDKNGGWAIFCRGTNVLINGHSSTVHPALSEYDSWKENVPSRGFDLAFKEYHDKLHGAAHPCCRFEFSTTAGRIPDNMKCPECLRIMEKVMTFICCHDENAIPGLFLTNTSI